MKNKLDGRKIIVAIIVIVLISIIGCSLYSYFNKEKKTSTDNTPPEVKDEYKISSVYQLALKDTEKEVTLKGKTVSFKYVNGLYVNGNLVANVKAESAQVTEQVIIFTYKGDCNQIISYVVDADGKSVPFTNSNYQLYDFRMLNDKLVAAGSNTCPCNDKTNCQENAAISITYTGKELVIR